MSITGTIGSGLDTLLQPIGDLASSAAGSVATAGLNAIGSWVLGGTESALKTVAQVIGTETAPNLQSAWFGSAYWRMAALGALLTVPFLLAAAIQALVRSDLALLLRSAFLYMPLSLIAVGLAAPVTMLLLAATDQMSAAVSAVGVEGGATFLDKAAGAAAAYSAAAADPFFVVVIGLFALGAALALALEMLVREAAVYVVVLMLPLGFAAMVWPARRVWATRLIELLVSLILSKFVIVAVLSLAGSAFASGRSGISELLVAMALVMLSVFAPWTLMRVLPFTEVAAGAAGALRRDLPATIEHSKHASNAGLGLVDPALGLAARFGLGSGGAGGDDPLTAFADAGSGAGAGAGSGAGAGAGEGRGAEPAGGTGSPFVAAAASATSDSSSAPSYDGALISLGGGESVAPGSTASAQPADRGTPAGGGPRPAMDAFWEEEWEELPLGPGLISDGIRYTPRGGAEQASSLDQPGRDRPGPEEPGLGRTGSETPGLGRIGPEEPGLGGIGLPRPDDPGAVHHDPDGGTEERS
jgi:hypothetical protein